MTDRKIAVSDHAIVRYLERVLGWDLEAIKRVICPEEVEKKILALGVDGAFPVNNGEYKLRVKNQVVVTVVTEKLPDRWRGFTSKGELIEKRDKANRKD